MTSIASLTADIKINISGKKTLDDLNKSLSKAVDSLSAMTGKKIPSSSLGKTKQVQAQSSQDSGVRKLNMEFSRAINPMLRFNGVLGMIMRSINGISLGAASLIGVASKLFSSSGAVAQTYGKYAQSTGGNSQLAQTFVRALKKQKLSVSEEEGLNALNTVSREHTNALTGEGTSYAYKAAGVGIGTDPVEAVIRKIEAINNLQVPDAVRSRLAQESGLTPAMLQLSASELRKQMAGSSPYLNADQIDDINRALAEFRSIIDSLKGTFIQLGHTIAVLINSLAHPVQAIKKIISEPAGMTNNPLNNLVIWGAKKFMGDSGDKNITINTTVNTSSNDPQSIGDSVSSSVQTTLDQHFPTPAQ